MSGRRHLPTLLVLTLSLALAMPALAKDRFRVHHPQIRLENGTYIMNLAVSFAFTREALEALDNGVPLTITTHIQVRRSDAWMWEDSQLDLQLRRAIRYRPLSKRYEVYQLPGASGREFVTHEAAIRALGEIADLRLVDQQSLDREHAYEVQLKVFLDIEELPLPLRPMAYLKPSWKLSSGWKKWPLTP